MHRALDKIREEVAAEFDRGERDFSEMSADIISLVKPETRTAYSKWRREHGKRGTGTITFGLPDWFW